MQNVINFPAPAKKEATIGTETVTVDLNYLVTRGNLGCLLVQIEQDTDNGLVADGDFIVIDMERKPEKGSWVLVKDDHYGADVTLYKTFTRDRGKEVLGVITHIISELVSMELAA